MSARLKTVIPLLIIASLFALMICHGAHGPYTVVNGPSTAFLSVKNATVVHISIVAAALLFIACVAAARLSAAEAGPVEERKFPTEPVGQLSCVFLC